MAGTVAPESSDSSAYLSNRFRRFERYTPPDGALAAVGVVEARRFTPARAATTDPVSVAAAPIDSVMAMPAASVGAGAAAAAEPGRVADPWAARAASAAHARLGQLRQRFRRGELPPLGHLIVRLRLPVPGGYEAPWVLVESWRVPAQLRGRCLNDGVHPTLAHIRMGRASTVELDQVIDWAVVDAGGEIVEGGWSRHLRHAPDLPAAASVSAPVPVPVSVPATHRATGPAS
ncbi:hypothetical protein I6A84_37855 [Frankia sp. CNm7]|uniref:DUF2314 domain-containing protein n=1 Tax=Frankia nepalensis TaxID=1836974 RepID=A0A937RD05_9ACTN|nr:hypothetical protein [Frankia nepalensis]MBL7499635.1 hypothetical protein [Frankia nepalensis]MBL7515979.1 hypothetical protein [Frankia nepalensis]MBL7523653.1 hypothetical protein [Frankia nepalensis]MBL7628012.1 hypothetical protein [Frankia nepalensis]